MLQVGRATVALSLFLWAARFLCAQAVTPAQQALSILSKNCANCHGALQQMSGYDLRTREAALRGGLRGVAIVPGKSDESALVSRLTGAVKPAMPLGATLKDSDIAVIKQWINDGAQWGRAQRQVGDTGHY
jgi:mono/diheme cytochrome c family protein